MELKLAFKNFYDIGNPDAIAYTQSASTSGASFKEQLMDGLAEGVIKSEKLDYIIKFLLLLI